jgi:hypothetical protein
MAKPYAHLGDLRPSLLATGACHPLHVMALSTTAILLLAVGSLASTFAFLLVDTTLLLLLLRWRPLRAHLDRRAHRRARRRAADRLALAELSEWRCIEALVRRTSRFNPRRRDVEGLVDTYLNVALAFGQARTCAEDAQVHLLAGRGPHLADIAEQRERASARTVSAIDTLRSQLETTQQLIRLNCEVAIAEQCEAGADLGRDEVLEAGAAAPMGA